MTGLFCVYLVKSVSILATFLMYFPIFLLCLYSIDIPTFSLIASVGITHLFKRGLLLYSLLCTVFHHNLNSLFICRGTTVK